MNNEAYLKETRLLDFNAPSIVRLTESRGWAELSVYDRIGAAYRFVKDEILFGYNESDAIPASQVLSEGYGQCNTKAVLLAALLRRLGIPCRIHAFRVDKKVQEGIVPEPFYRLAPATLIHMWAEILYKDRWVNLEGCILDPEYLSSVQETWAGCEGRFCGFGVAVADVTEASTAWKGEDTYIQVDSIVEDLGVFDSPDEMYRTHGENLGPILRLMFKHVIRKLMNRRADRIRKGKIAAPEVRGTAKAGRARP